MKLKCGMLHVYPDDDGMAVEKECGKPAQRRIKGTDEGCCDDCFDKIMKHDPDPSWEKDYPLEPNAK